MRIGNAKYGFEFDRVGIKCESCGFTTERLVEDFKNQSGYYEIPESYCPNDFHLLVMTPIEVKENADI